MMKHIITCLLVLGHCCGYSQIVIKGKIHNYDGESKVFYHPTLEGIHTPYWKEVTPNPNGKFKIQYENKGYGTIRIRFYELSYRFFHDENTEIYFEIDQADINFPKNRRGFNISDSIKQIATKEISGDFEEVNQFYNKNLRSSYITSRSMGDHYTGLIANAKTPEKVMTMIDSLTQVELSQINRLATKVDVEQENSHSKSIDENVKKFLENEVRAFYGSIFLSGMHQKRYKQVTQLTKDSNAPIYNKEWETLIEAFFDEIPNTIVSSANSFDFNELVQNLAYTKEEYKKYDFNDPGTSFDEYVIETLLQPDAAILDTLFLLDEKSALAYKVDKLKEYLYSQTFYSPVLLSSINELKKQHPRTAHFQHFEPQIEKLKAYLKASTEEFDKAEFIETNYVKFNDLLETFKGKNILIDVWATWCGPCIEEFKYKSFLQPFIEEGNLTMLYISIDKQRWKNKWRENIKYNQLEGYHVLANDVLIKDMWEVLAGMQGAIPRYALVDKEGNIFINEAARPSESEILIKQINSLIASSGNETTKNLKDK